VLLRSIKSFLTNLKSHRGQRSYSQSGEDLIVRFIFNILGIARPSYIDIGAHHPFFLSNTAHFYWYGSRGINIEPNPLLFDAFIKHRKHDINLNIGALDHPGEMDFYVMSPPTMSTFSEKDAKNLVAQHKFKIQEKRKIRVETINEVLTKYAYGASPEFFSIDVEGFEKQILNSIDFMTWCPKVICCETMSFSTTGEGKKDLTIAEHLKSRGYMVYADTYINTIFVLENVWKAQQPTVTKVGATNESTRLELLHPGFYHASKNGPPTVEPDPKR